MTTPLPDSAPGGPAVGDVHRFVPGTSGATLLVLHGTGGDEDDLLPLAKRLAPDANLLSPRGPVLEHGMPRFFRRHAIGELDQEDLLRRTGELADFVRASARCYRFDPSRVLAVGYSNGANIATSLLLREPTLLQGAVLLRALLPFEADPLPRLPGTPIYLAAGRADPYVAPAQVEALADLLQRAGADVTLAWSPSGHGLEPSEIDAAAAWIHSHRS